MIVMCMEGIWTSDKLLRWLGLARIVYSFSLADT